MRRSEQRRAAVWVLYQSDLLSRPLEETFPRDTHGFTRALAGLVREHQPELDELISEHAKGWSLDRIAPLERSILRVGLVELLYPDELPGDQAIPPEGAINEAVEIGQAVLWGRGAGVRERHPRCRSARALQRGSLAAAWRNSAGLQAPPGASR